MCVPRQLASEGIKREYTQSLFDTANYTFEEKDGDVLMRQVKESLGNYFHSKRITARVSYIQHDWLKKPASFYR